MILKRIVVSALLIVLAIPSVHVQAVDPIPIMEYTEQDIYDMGDSAYSENGHTGKTKDEIIQNLIATMGVILNRYLSGDKWMRNSKYTGIRSVIMASGQYADKTKQDLGNIDTPDWVYELAEEVMIYGTNLPSYVIFQSTQSNLGTPWKVIAGEYYATGGGHYMEGKDIVITTNKKKYETELKKQEYEFKKKIKAMIQKSYSNFSKLLEYKQQQLNTQGGSTHETVLCQEGTARH